MRLHCPCPQPAQGRTGPACMKGPSWAPGGSIHLFSLDTLLTWVVGCWDVTQQHFQTPGEQKADVGGVQLHQPKHPGSHLFLVSSISSDPTLDSWEVQPHSQCGRGALAPQTPTFEFRPDRGILKSRGLHSGRVVVHME